MISEKDVIVRVISLNDSSTRRDAVSLALSEFPLEWEFFDAYRADTPSHLEVDPKRQIAALGRTLTPAEIGTTKSHYHVLDCLTKHEHAKWALVLEDDVLVDCQFDYLGFLNFIASKGINHARLFTKYFRSGKIIDWFGSYQLVRMGQDPFGAQGYFMSREAAEVFQASITHVDRPMDEEHARFWDKGFPIYAIFPFPILERAVPSTQDSARQAAIDESAEKYSPRSLSRWKDALARRWTIASYYLGARH
jgi:glycosyl transferase family 25